MNKTLYIETEIEVPEDISEDAVLIWFAEILNANKDDNSSVKEAYFVGYYGEEYDDE